MEFCEKLVLLRKEKEWTQEQLAEELFVSRTAVSKWETGRGYPGIESLRVISAVFHVSIDDLLSGEELIRAAEADSRGTANHMRGLVFGVLDAMLALLLFLPLFGQRAGENVLHVSLLILATVSQIRVVFLLFVALVTLFGVAELALQNWERPLWQKRTAFSLLLSVLGVVLFTASPQPYAATFVFALLVVKGFLLIKPRNT